jgi:hypothetical protein
MSREGFHAPSGRVLSILTAVVSTIYSSSTLAILSQGHRHTKLYTCPTLIAMLMTLLCIVLHLSQSTHDVNWVDLSSNLLKFRVVDTHKDIVFLISLVGIKWDFV